MLCIDCRLDVRNLAPHLVHLPVELGEEEIEISTLIFDQAVEEDLVLLDDRLLVVEVLLLENVVEDATLLLIDDSKHLGQLLSLAEAR